jgi:hypothetical protein
MKCLDPFSKLRIQHEDLKGLHPELVEGVEALSTIIAIVLITDTRYLAFLFLVWFTKDWYFLVFHKVFLYISHFW